MNAASSNLHDRLKSLRRLPPSPRLAALACTLPIAHPDEAESLAIEVLDLAVPPAPTTSSRFARISRNRDEAEVADDALSLLFANWDRLSPLVRNAIASLEGARLSQALRQMLSDDDAVPAALRVVQEAEFARSVLVEVPPLLGHAQPAIAELAERALLDLVFRVRAGLDPTAARSGSRPELPLTIEAFESIASAVASACHRFAEHRRRGVLHGAILLLSAPGGFGKACPQLQSLLREPGHPAGGALRSALRASRSPPMREAALRLLARDDLAAAAIDRLAKAYTSEDHAMLLAHGHLIERPVRHRRLGVVSLRARQERDARGITRASFGPEAPLPDAAAFEALSEPARRMLPRVASSMELDATAAVHALQALLADASPEVRLAALRVAPAALRDDFAFDSNPHIARSAVWRRSFAAQTRWAFEAGSRASASSRRHNHLCRSPHAQVRAAAEAELDRESILRASAPSRTLLRSRLAHRSQETVPLLTRQMLTGETPDRIAAVQAARRAEAVSQFAETLFDLTHDRDVFVVAAAASALGDIDAPDAAAPLHALLEHADGRVRADAIEAIVKRSLRLRASERAAELLEFKADDVPRARANAILGAIRSCAAEPRVSRSAHAALLNMLQDERPAHRRSAVWAAQRSPAALHGPSLDGSLVAAIQTLAQTDTDEQVRLRADRCARRVIGESRPVRVAS